MDKNNNIQGQATIEVLSLIQTEYLNDDNILTCIITVSTKQIRMYRIMKSMVLVALIVLSNPQDKNILKILNCLGFHQRFHSTAFKLCVSTYMDVRTLTLVI